MSNTISRSSGGMSAMLMGDPMMSLEMMMIDQCRQDHDQNKLARDVENAVADAAVAKAADEESAAATARLVGGLFGAAGSIVHGITTVGSAAQSEADARSRSAGTTAANQAAGTTAPNQAAGTNTPSHAADAPGTSHAAGTTPRNADSHSGTSSPTAPTSAQTNQNNGAASRAAANWSAAGDFGGAAGQIGSTIAERVASGQSIAAKNLERQAERAKASAQDLNENASEAREMGQRMMGRMEEIMRAQRQAEDARIANMRG